MNTDKTMDLYLMTATQYNNEDDTAYSIPYLVLAVDYRDAIVKTVHQIIHEDLTDKEPEEGVVGSEQPPAIWVNPPHTHLFDENSFPEYYSDEFGPYDIRETQEEGWVISGKLFGNTVVISPDIKPFKVQKFS